jgi:hypothetical protein
MTFSSVDAARRTALALQGRRVDDPVWGAFTSFRRRGRRNLLANPGRFLGGSMAWGDGPYRYVNRRRCEGADSQRG